MKKWWRIGLLLVLYLVAFAANVGHFGWSYPVGWIQVVTSAIYAAAWLWFLASGHRRQETLRISVWVSALTLVGGIVGLLARTLGSGILTVFGVLTAGLSVTPLYGLLGLMQDYDALYLTVAALGAVWLAVSLWLGSEITGKSSARNIDEEP